MRKFTLFLALLVAIVTTASAQAPLNETVVFDFTNAAWGIPTMEENYYSSIKTAGEYTDGINTIKIDPTANKGSYIYDSKGFLNLGKPGSKIILPAFGFAVEKIEVVGHPSASSYPNVDMNVYVGKTAVSTPCIGSTATSKFEIAASNQAAGNIYELVIGSNGGNYSSYAYITYIKVYPAENKFEAPAFDLASGVYVGEQTVNVHSATADLEGVTDVIYYYTTDGNEPTAEDEETDSEIIITESCTLKVVVELTYGDKVYTSASSSAEYIISEEVTYSKAAIVANGSYFLVADNKVSTPIGGTTLKTKGTTVNGNEVTEALYYALTIEETDGGCYIKDVNGNYIYTTMMTNKLNYGTYPSGVWTITITDDESCNAIIEANDLVLVYVDGEFIASPVGEVPANAVYPTLYGTQDTGIDEVKGENGEVKTVYDIHGRKIKNITNRGIYIVGSKKILVK